ncbi:MAG: N-acetylmuramoyl-L-alanine amidase [Actinomycetota bacterium]
MGSDRRTFLRSLVAVSVVAAGGFGRAARALGRAPSGIRVAVLAVRPAPSAYGAGGGALQLGEVGLPFPTTHVGLQWQGSEADLIEICWRVAGEWGAWRRLPIWDDAGDPDAGLVATGLVRPQPGAGRLGVRWSAGATDPQVVAIDAGVDPAPPLLPAADPERIAYRNGASSAQASRPAGAGRQARPRRVANRSEWQPEIITRAGWGADEGLRKGSPEFAPVSKLVVHHTVTENNDPDPAQTVRAIYAYHTRGNGWNDIGYNFLVDQQGRVYEGRFARRYGPGEAPTGEDERGRGVVGAHARGVNPGTVGVAVLGDYSGGVVPPGPALDGLVKALAWKAARHDIDPGGTAPFTARDGARRTFPNIAGHRDVDDTGCPGGRLYDRLPAIRQRVADTIGAPAAPPHPPLPEFAGFWVANADGRIRAFGDVRSAGDLAGQTLGGPVVSLAATPAGHGYWMLGADGGVFAFGDAPFLGSSVGRLRSPAVHLEPTPTGKGYWVLSAAGEVVPFGDAALWGQLFPVPVNTVGLAATPTGRGYWIATADSRVFAFGDALLAGTAGSTLAAGGMEGASTRPSGPIVAIAASPDGQGYWLLGRDGGVFSFGVPFYGSVVERRPYEKAVDLRATDSGAGYYVTGSDGAVFAFGDADPRREQPAGGPDTVVDVAFRPTAGRPPAPAPGPPGVRLASKGLPVVPGARAGGDHERFGC